MNIHTVEYCLGFLLRRKAIRAEGQADGIARVLDTDDDEDDGDGHLTAGTAETDTGEDIEPGNKLIGDQDAR